jgi:hypothetical protein
MEHSETIFDKIRTEFFLQKKREKKAFEAPLKAYLAFAICVAAAFFYFCDLDTDRSELQASTAFSLLRGRE